MESQPTPNEGYLFFQISSQQVLTIEQCLLIKNANDGGEGSRKYNEHMKKTVEGYQQLFKAFQEHNNIFVKLEGGLLATVQGDGVECVVGHDQADDETLEVLSKPYNQQLIKDYYVQKNLPIPTEHATVTVSYEVNGQSSYQKFGMVGVKKERWFEILATTIVFILRGLVNWGARALKDFLEEKQRILRQRPQADSEMQVLGGGQSGGQHTVLEVQTVTVNRPSEQQPSGGGGGGGQTDQNPTNREEPRAQDPFRIRVLRSFVGEESGFDYTVRLVSEFGGVLVLIGVLIFFDQFVEADYTQTTTVNNFTDQKLQLQVPFQANVISPSKNEQILQGSDPKQSVLHVTGFGERDMTKSRMISNAQFLSQNYSKILNGLSSLITLSNVTEESNKSPDLQNIVAQATIHRLTANKTTLSVNETDNFDNPDALFKKQYSQETDIKLKDHYQLKAGSQSRQHSEFFFRLRQLVTVQCAFKDK